MVTPELLHHFAVFGFVRLPGLLADDIGWITEEFEKVWREHGIRADGTPRDAVVPFIDNSARLCGLLDHPLLEPAVEAFLGADFNYLASDGRPYSGDTGWHPDGGWDEHALFAKVAFYLDPLRADTGALRVIPGSHRRGDGFAADSREAGRSPEMFGCAMSAVPAYAIETMPGDVVLFDHNLMHASFGGGKRRRMFTMNVGRRARNPLEVERLREYIGIHLQSWGERTHGPLMRDNPSPARLQHLEQVWDNEGHLPELHRKFLAAKSARIATAP